MEFDLRYSSLEDGKFLQKWLLEKGELENFPMSKPEEVEESVKNWIGFSKFKASLTAYNEEGILAIGTLFLMPYRKIAHHCLFYLIVDPQHRKKGIGTSLLKNLANLAKKYFQLESMHAEVYEGSLLIPLLEKQGFTLFLTQKNYVQEKKGCKARLLWEKTL